MANFPDPKILRFLLWRRRNGTDHISAPTILPQQVCKENWRKAGFVLVAGMSAISGNGRGREREADRQTGRGFLDKELAKKRKKW